MKIRAEPEGGKIDSENKAPMMSVDLDL